MAGHVDKWCKANCDPRKFSDLDDVSSVLADLHVCMTMCVLYVLQTNYYLAQVDTEVCEQTFSWFSKYGKMTRKMNRYVYMFFIIYLCDLHNEREIEKLKRSNYSPC